MSGIFKDKFSYPYSRKHDRTNTVESSLSFSPRTNEMRRKKVDEWIERL